MRVGLGMDLFTCSLLVLLWLGFGGILSGWVGLGLAYPCLDAWRNKVSADLCGREGFWCGPLLHGHGFLQLLNSSVLFIPGLG